MLERKMLKNWLPDVLSEEILYCYDFSDDYLFDEIEKELEKELLNESRNNTGGDKCHSILE